ncbi:hypothetical protein CKO28_08785 [Rhodovibrio sodomensis]|uniref:DUF4864 domain-containing protein n=1 Tax=Rhodovibrio sodomensis TaxID=1088 RepID=A0ABS1DCK0_9PROT|nr:DUF4864 domain-containing protein [Rhodovibrio sodomensis]MBK1668130.1 hypothetical protein [Rhodovibrio sodomensis]
MPKAMSFAMPATLRTILAGLTALAALALSTGPAPGQEILQPNPAFSPKKVVSIQLKALQRNDTPDPDAGIRQTWAFAHPDNRQVTGPYPRFQRMIKMPSYEVLLGHSDHVIEKVAQTDGVARFAVTVTAPSGQVYGYRWEVRKIAEGEHAGAWATTAVSPAMDAGDST